MSAPIFSTPNFSAAGGSVPRSAPVVPVQRRDTGHLGMVHDNWRTLQGHLINKQQFVTVDGSNITLPDVIAVAGHQVRANLSTDPMFSENIERSVAVLESEIANGAVIYGVNTGFGGSADVRTTQLRNLQVALQQLLNVGILLPSDKGLLSSEEDRSPMQAWRAHALPTQIVRAMMLIRSNSLARGHSCVRREVIESILKMLNAGLTPVIPLRGSISASGDLSSLSYLAGALEGNPDIYVRVGRGKAALTKPCNEALLEASIPTVTLQAKEGLGITNGTAASAAAAALALSETNHLTVLSQLLTAFATEAFLGTSKNYSAFVSEARPHPGQIEVAGNITKWLQGSKLATDTDPAYRALAQDRYPLRTAPQWLGPLVENLMLANQQVVQELNSTTDNPLIDSATGVIHHGGNFQAVSVTSAMEKVAGVLQNIAKILFAGCSELLNMHMSRGLPPNLSADDPSTSFTMKGLDISMAAYMAEIAHLAHPVSNYVQSTEMHNQSINSMALLAARVAMESAELVSLMAATYIFALCQAVDLRCLHLEFLWHTEPLFNESIKDIFSANVAPERIDDFSSKLWAILIDKWLSLCHLDLTHRAAETVQEAFGLSLPVIESYKTEQALDILAFASLYSDKVGHLLSEAYDEVRSKFFANPKTPAYLSPTTNSLYAYIRQDLNIPMHRGLVDHPNNVPGDKNRIIGTLVSDIYVSLRNGKLHDRVMSATIAQPEKNMNILSQAASVSEEVTSSAGRRTSVVGTPGALPTQGIHGKPELMDLNVNGDRRRSSVVGTPGAPGTLGIHGKPEPMELHMNGERRTSYVPGMPGAPATLGIHGKPELMELGTSSDRRASTVAESPGAPPMRSINEKPEMNGWSMNNDRRSPSPFGGSRGRGIHAGNDRRSPSPFSAGLGAPAAPAVNGKLHATETE